jgi:hypothetical protein
MYKIIPIVALLALAGCASNNAPASVVGECKVFTDPGFRVMGVRSKDKQWIANTTETGIQVCGWQRPARSVQPVDCATANQVLTAFGGDQKRAEAYAVANGMTQAQLVQVRKCKRTA